MDKDIILKLIKEKSLIAGLAYIEYSLQKQGFYAPSELIQMAIKNNISIDNPYTIKIKKGTQIQSNVCLGNNITIDGNDVKIGAGSFLENCLFKADNITIDQNNQMIRTTILQSNIIIGKNNQFTNTKIAPQLGTYTDANLTIGNHNKFGQTQIANETGEVIWIGNNNMFGDNLTIRSYHKGWIIIGNHNSLGMDGGGVISTPYRYNKHYCGPLIIGYAVSSKRGAELLGLGTYGISLEEIKKYFPNQDCNNLLKETFICGDPNKARFFLEKIKPLEFEEKKPASEQILIVGVAKPKFSALLRQEGKKTKIRDNTRIQHSIIEPGSNVYENKHIYFSKVSEIQQEKLSENHTQDGYPKENWDIFFT